MSGGIVLDASVAAKLLLDEDLSPNARALFRDTVTARQPVCAPPLLPAEILSVLFQRARGLASGRRSAGAGGITFEQAAELLAGFQALEIELVAPPDLYARALADAHARALPEQLRRDLRRPGEVAGPGAVDGRPGAARRPGPDGAVGALDRPLPRRVPRRPAGVAVGFRTGRSLRSGATVGLPDRATGGTSTHATTVPSGSPSAQTSCASRGVVASR